MKKRNLILNGCFALTMGLLFAQCNNNQGAAPAANAAQSPVATDNSGLKIAYVEVDSLIAQYQFCIDMNEDMVKKEENIRAKLNSEAKKLENEQKEFQYKYENNAFTQKRAEEEYNRLAKKAQDLEVQRAQFAEELAQENAKNNLQLRDSIDNFLKEYNKEKQYSFIISNAGYDNLLYADPAYNITKEIVDGLNKRYTPKKD